MWNNKGLSGSARSFKSTGKPGGKGRPGDANPSSATASSSNTRRPGDTKPSNGKAPSAAGPSPNIRTPTTRKPSDGNISDSDSDTSGEEQGTKQKRNHRGGRGNKRRQRIEKRIRQREQENVERAKAGLPPLLPYNPVIKEEDSYWRPVQKPSAANVSSSKRLQNTTKVASSNASGSKRHLDYPPTVANTIKPSREEPEAPNTADQEQTADSDSKPEHNPSTLHTAEAADSGSLPPVVASSNEQLREEAEVLNTADQKVKGDNGSKCEHRPNTAATTESADTNASGLKHHIDLPPTVANTIKRSRDPEIVYTTDMAAVADDGDLKPPANADADSSKQLHDLNQKLERKEKDYENLYNAVTLKENELDQLTKDLASCRKDGDAARKEANHALKQLGELTNDNAQLQQTVDEKTLECSNAKKDVAELKKDCSTKAAALTLLMEERDVLKSEFREMQAMYESTQSTLDGAHETIEKLANELELAQAAALKAAENQDEVDRINLTLEGLLTEEGEQLSISNIVQEFREVKKASESKPDASETGSVIRRVSLGDELDRAGEDDMEDDEASETADDASTLADGETESIESSKLRKPVKPVMIDRGVDATPMGFPMKDRGSDPIKPTTVDHGTDAMPFEPTVKDSGAELIKPIIVHRGTDAKPLELTVKPTMVHHGTDARPLEPTVKDSGDKPIKPAMVDRGTDANSLEPALVHVLPSDSNSASNPVKMASRFPWWLQLFMALLLVAAWAFLVSRTHKERQKWVNANTISYNIVRYYIDSNSPNYAYGGY